MFGEGEQNLSVLFRSNDDGVTWQYVTDIFPLFWATLFVYDGKLCAVGCSKEYGDMQVLTSDDSGTTWQGVIFAKGSFDTDMAGFHRCPGYYGEQDFPCAVKFCTRFFCMPYCIVKK